MIDAAFARTSEPDPITTSVIMEGMAGRAGRPQKLIARAPNRIQAVRQARGLRREELGEAIGLTHEQIRKYETGINEPTLKRLEQMARVLKVPAHQLLNSYELGSDEQEQILLSVFRQLQTAERDTVLQMLLGLASQHGRRAHG